MIPQLGRGLGALQYLGLDKPWQRMARRGPSGTPNIGVHQTSRQLDSFRETLIAGPRGCGRSAGATGGGASNLSLTPVRPPSGRLLRMFLSAVVC